MTSRLIYSSSVKLSKNKSIYEIRRKLTEHMVCGKGIPYTISIIYAKDDNLVNPPLHPLMWKDVSCCERFQGYQTNNSPQ